MTSSSSRPTPFSAPLTTSSLIIHSPSSSYSLLNVSSTIIPKTVRPVKALLSPLTPFSKYSGLNPKDKKKSLEPRTVSSLCVHSLNPNNFTATTSRISKNGKSNSVNSWISSISTNFSKQKKDSVKVTLLLYTWASSWKIRKKWPSRLSENKLPFHSKTVDKLYSTK